MSTSSLHSKLFPVGVNLFVQNRQYMVRLWAFIISSIIKDEHRTLGPLHGYIERPIQNEKNIKHLLLFLFTRFDIHNKHLN